MAAFKFLRTTGQITNNGKAIATAYSGAPDYKNNPAFEKVADQGPIPAGVWRMTGLTEGETPHGPYVIQLTPVPGTNAYGRSGFLIHGDSIEHPGAASKGCIITDRKTRELLWSDLSREIEVV